MSRYGSDPRFMRERFGSPKGVGPTGQFPDGRINESDGGQLTVATAADPTRGLVLIDFGAAVAWLAMTPAAALAFADDLRNKALEIDPGGA